MNLLVEGLGMVTPLAHDAATSCAAIRAGLTRAAPLTDAAVLDPDTQEMVPAIGHPVWGLTEGKAAIARWLSMARHAFADLRRSAALPAPSDAGFWSRTSCVVVSSVDNGDRFAFAPECYAELIEATYITPLRQQLGLGMDPQQVYHLGDGRTGVLRAFAGAEQLLANGRVDRVIVLAVDSYLDGHTLQWLSETERLKSAERPTGLMPGEGAVAILVSAAAGTGSRTQRVRIRAAAVDREEEDYLSGQQRHGRALARALTAALRASAAPPPVDADLYTDLNGEAWRAYELGAALAQISADLLRTKRLNTPAICVGDLGAASALLSIGLAASAFERRYARSTRAIVTCMSGSGQVGAVVVEQS
jgi:3-oxoacyl-[acyl-carrier-protein] synthase-1